MSKISESDDNHVWIHVRCWEPVLNHGGCQLRFLTISTAQIPVQFHRQGSWREEASTPLLILSKFMAELTRILIVHSSHAMIKKPIKLNQIK